MHVSFYLLSALGIPQERRTLFVLPETNVSDGVHSLLHNEGLYFKDAAAVLGAGKIPLSNPPVSHFIQCLVGLGKVYVSTHRRRSCASAQLGDQVSLKLLTSLS